MTNNLLDDIDGPNVDLDTTVAQRSATEHDLDDDLDSLIAETVEHLGEETRIRKARKRLAEGRAEPGERERLVAAVAAYDEARTWETVAQVALVHVQACATCSSTSEIFMGWMQEQAHRREPTTRRLVAGESALRLPLRLERHVLKARAQCCHCLDAYIRARQAVALYQLPQRRVRNED